MDTNTQEQMNPFEAVALQLLAAAATQFTAAGITALMKLITDQINAQAAK